MIICHKARAVHGGLTVIHGPQIRHVCQRNGFNSHRDRRILSLQDHVVHLVHFHIDIDHGLLIARKLISVYGHFLFADLLLFFIQNADIEAVTYTGIIQIDPDTVHMVILGHNGL